MKNGFLIISLLLVSISCSVRSQTVTVNYNYDNSIIRNPERGIYWHSEVHTGNDPKWGGHPNFQSIESYLAKAQNKDLSLILRVYYLDKYKESNLDNNFLEFLERDFNLIRDYGFKIIIRFAYNRFVEYDKEGNVIRPVNDANPNIVKKHIKQLSPILEEHKDIIFAFQAGFIGTWGEWSYTDHFNSPSTKNEVLDNLINAFPKDRMILIRRPDLKWSYFESKNTITPYEAFSESPISRIGFHNDCFLAPNNDAGTYRDPVEFSKNYMKNETQWVLMGGETCALNPPRTDCENAIKELEEHHWTFLNLLHKLDVVENWEKNGCFSEIFKKLGYRFSLIKGTFPDRVQLNDQLSIELELYNEGWASLYNPRNFEIIIRNKFDGSEYGTFFKEDPRFWHSGDTIKITGDFGVPSSISPGSYELLVNLPDKNFALRNDPRYSIRLANQNIFEKETGYNKLLHDIEIEDNSSINTTLSNRNSRAPSGYNGSNWMVPIDSLRFLKSFTSIHSFSIYPNPVSLGSNIQISFKSTSEGELNLKIFDINGNITVENNIIPKLGVNIHEVSSTNLPGNSGLYTLVITSGEDTNTLDKFKLIIK